MKWKELQISKKKILTDRETKLLLILICVSIFFVFYKNIIISQKLKMEKLKRNNIYLKEKNDDINKLISNRKSIDNDWTKLKRKKQSLMMRYFQKLDQSRIIYILDKNLLSSNLRTENIYFSRSKSEKIDDFSIDFIDINIPYEGDYNSLINFLSCIRSNPKKILINSVTIDKTEKDILSGEISLKVYSLMNKTENQKSDIFVGNNKHDNKNDNREENLVKCLEENQYDNLEKEEIQSKPVNENRTNNINDKSKSKSDNKSEMQKKILEDFEDSDVYFMGSNPEIEGKILKSNKFKSGNSSIRFEYNIPMIKEGGRAYIVLDDRNIILNSSSSDIGIWIYSYGGSSKINIRFIDKKRNPHVLPLTRKDSWNGWKYIKVKLTQDKNLYPLKLDRIFVQTDCNEEDIGVLFLDQLEVYFDVQKKNNNIGKKNCDYIYYAVQKDDTLDSICMKIYGNISNKDKIKKLNNIKNDKLILDKILILPKN